MTGIVGEVNKGSETYSIIETDAQSWLEQAELHFYSARIIAGHFEKISLRPPTYPGMRIAKLACIKSLLLLLAFGLENALKALIIKSTESDEKIEWRNHGGSTRHDLVKLSESTNIEINDAQKELLERLTVFSIWAGRYRLPIMNNNRYVDDCNKLKLNWPDDITFATEIFDQIKINLDQ